MRSNSLAAFAVIALLAGCGGDSAQNVETYTEEEWEEVTGDGSSVAVVEGDNESSDGSVTSSAMMTADELTQLCLTQPDLVEATYHGQPITVSGVVQDLELNRVSYYESRSRLEFQHRWTLQCDNFSEVAINPFNLLSMTVLCRCTSDPDEAASRESLVGIQVGQMVTVEGTLWFTGDEAVIDDASIIQSEPAPGDAPPAGELMTVAQLDEFQDGHAAAEAALEQCNSPGGQPMTDDGRLKPEILEALRHVPYIEELKLRDSVSAEGLRDLLTLPPIWKLTFIYAFAPDVTASDIASLSQIRELKSLHFFRTSSEQLSGVAEFAHLHTLQFDKDDQEEPLPDLSRLVNLRQLSIGRAHPDDAAVAARLPRLRHLSLLVTEVTADSFDALAGVDSLRSLELTIDAADVNGLAALGNLTSLRGLRIRFSESMNPPSLGDLEPIGRLADLQILDIGCRVEAGCGQHLAELGNLQAVAISAEGFGDDELSAFLATEKPFLKRLTLDQAAVGDVGVAAIVPEALPQLNQLELDKTQISDASLEALGLAALPRLETISLQYTAVTDAGVAHLASIPNLRSVTAYNTAVTREAIDRALNSEQ